MVDIPLGRNAYRRIAAGTPEIRVVNRFFETSPTNLKESAALLARPGTVVIDTLGGDSRGRFSQPGAFGGDLFTVYGTTLYRCSDDGTHVTISGTVSGTGHVSMALMSGVGYTILFIANGTSLQFYEDAAALVTVATPGSVGISALAGLAGYVLAAQANSDRMYFIEPGAVIIDALNFVTAEYEPDKIEDIIVVGDSAYVIGQSVTEVWYATGQADPAFAPNQGRTFHRGMVSGTAVRVKENIMLVGDDGNVYVLGNPTPVSTNSIAERIRKRRRPLTVC